ncbi:hypothetical protein [Mesorhizobium silamurunense]|uniref:hypothetical protein n=1 Tax=Mesorhizobium silamurunense TaxID=499528 RepID=UPI00177D7A57|nr:hypothetical protein [Mesorhizobium silamurunense]
MAPIVGVIAAGWHSWIVLQQWQADRQAQYVEQFNYECAARLPVADLRARMNEFGNINIKDLCLTGRDFFVSEPELERVRAGTMKFETTYHPFDVQGALIIGGFWAVLTALAALALLGVTFLGQWVWGFPATGRDDPE